MEVYIEFAIVDNFVIDLLLLIATKKILKLETKKWQIVLATCFATTYAVFSPYIKIYGILLFILKLCVGAIIICIAFCPKTLKKFYLELVVFMFLTFLLGGICLALNLTSHSVEYTIDGTIYSFDFPLSLLVASVCIFWFLGEKLVKYFSRNKQISKFVYDVEIFFGNTKIKTKGYLDSANYVFDKQNHCPVIFVSQIKYLEFLNKNFERAKDFRQIQISTMSDKKQQIPCFSLDKIVIYFDGKKIIHNNITLALSQQNFSRNTSADLLLSPYLFE